MEMVDRNLRNLQMKEMEILKEIRTICEKHGITYYIDCGTLLGAVRHKGFIPWDDDIDVVMPYKEYMRFLKIAEEELSSRFFLQNYCTDENFYRSYTIVRMNNTTMMQKHHTKYHIHQGVGVDIFPLIEIGEKIDQKIKIWLIKLSNFLQMEDYICANYEEFESTIGTLGLKVLFLFYKIPMKFRKKMHTSILNFICQTKGKRNLTEIWCAITDIIPKSVFEGEAKEVEFEGEMFKAPPQYKEYLKLLYGDYMKLPPLEERKGHGDLLIDTEHDYSIYQE